MVEIDHLEIDRQQQLMSCCQTAAEWCCMACLHPNRSHFKNNSIGIPQICGVHFWGVNLNQKMYQDSGQTYCAPFKRRPKRFKRGTKRGPNFEHKHETKKEHDTWSHISMSNGQQRSGFHNYFLYNSIFNREKGETWTKTERQIHKKALWGTL